MFYYVSRKPTLRIIKIERIAFMCYFLCSNIVAVWSNNKLLFYQKKDSFISSFGNVFFSDCDARLNAAQLKMDYFTPSYSMPLWGWSVIGVGVAVIVLPIIIFVFYQIFSKMGPPRPEHERHRSRRRIVCHLCRRTVAEENW